MTIGSSHPPVLPWTLPLKTLIVPESNKRLKALRLPAIIWTEAYAGALYDFNNTLEGIGDGLADIGWVGSLWEPAKQPLQNVAYYSPFVTGDFRALVEVQNQLMEKVPAFAAEWTKHNTVFLGAQVADTYHLVTKFPVTKLEDLKGRKLLAPGAIASRVQGIGVTAVDAGLPVFYNMLQTGVADGAVILITGVLPFKLHEVAPYITKVDLGAVFSGALAMNKKTFDGLTPQMQQVFRQIGNEYAKMCADLVAQREASTWAALAKMPNVTVSEMPAAERAKWAKALPDVAGDRARRNGEPAAGPEDLHGGGAQARREAAREWDRSLGKAWIHFPGRGFGALTLGMNSVGTLWIFALMFLICADVAGRYLLNAPIKGAAEMVGYSIVTAVFLQMASTLRAGRFTRVEMLIEPLEARRPAAGHALNAVYHLVGAAVFAVITWGTWPKLADACERRSPARRACSCLIWPFSRCRLGAAVTVGSDPGLQPPAPDPRRWRARGLSPVGSARARALPGSLSRPEQLQVGLSTWSACCCSSPACRRRHHDRGRLRRHRLIGRCGLGMRAA
jgi:TRAP-type C4-dicarboxylate transport system substrate-binding protein/TRAP-type C4-dicarboxylate transport system permease small subunit